MKRNASLTRATVAQPRPLNEGLSVRRQSPARESDRLPACADRVVTSGFGNLKKTQGRLDKQLPLRRRRSLVAAPARGSQAQRCRHGKLPRVLEQCHIRAMEHLSLCAPDVDMPIVAMASDEPPCLPEGLPIQRDWSSGTGRSENSASRTTSNTASIANAPSSSSRCGHPTRYRAPCRVTPSGNRRRASARAPGNVVASIGTTESSVPGANPGSSAGDRPGSVGSGRGLT